MNKIPDLLGWNIYPGWYTGWGTKEDFGAVLDKHRYDSRQGGICISEYGAGANIDAARAKSATARTPTGQWHPEEWQADGSRGGVGGDEESGPSSGARSSGTCSISRSTPATKASLPGLNDKGLVTYDQQERRRTRFTGTKPTGRRSRSMHITSSRFTERTNAVTDVKIYSNAKEVELLVNGSFAG